MSVQILSTVFKAEIPDLPYTKNGEQRKAKASTVKLMLLAYADHSNDDGEASYPGYTLLERNIPEPAGHSGYARSPHPERIYGPGRCEQTWHQ